MSAHAATRLRLPLSSPQVLSTTSAMLWAPESPTTSPAVVLGHGAGSDMTSALLCAAGRGLAERGHPVLMFNFAYAEAGQRRPDPPARLEQAFRDAVALARREMGPRALVLGGRSMGGRIASRIAAGSEPCDGLLLFGYPLHPAGKPEKLRTDHWSELRQPVLFIQGDRDGLCDLDLLQQERERQLVNAVSEVHIVAGADHGFGVRKRDGRSPAEVLAEAVGAAGDWLDRTFGATGTDALAS